MTTQEIEILFTDTINRKDASKVTDLSKHSLYKYRHGTVPTLGTMMEVLYKAGKIKVEKNESQETKE